MIENSMALPKTTFEIICPVFNEQVTVPLFFQQIVDLRTQLSSRYDVTLRFIDNASADQTQNLVRELCQKHGWVSLIVMSRNFGYQCSVECGLRNSRADLSAVLDVDCEDPPQLFIEFLKLIEDGYDVVYGERLDREEGELLKALRKLYYRIARFVADDHFILDMAEYCIMSRMVREAVVADQSSFPFIRASIGRVGFAVKNVPYKRQKRIAGETHYNFWRMYLFGIAGILASSTLWLRVPAYLFPFWVLGVVSLAIATFQTGAHHYYQTLVVMSLIYFGFTLTGISLYLARVYKNGLQRPNYFINFKKSIIKSAAIHD